MSARKNPTINDLVKAMNNGSYHARCDVLRNLCPCRNNRNRELEVWHEIFTKARLGGLQERNRAAHAIGTLITKAYRSNEWRDLLQQCSKQLDELMLDPRASTLLLGQMKKHGHAHRGAAMQSFRRVKRVLELVTPAQLSEWLNEQLQLPNHIEPNDPGVQRLWRWHKHRVNYQPKRSTEDGELLRKAEQYLPHKFRQGAR